MIPNFVKKAPFQATGIMAILIAGGLALGNCGAPGSGELNPTGTPIPVATAESLQMSYVNAVVNDFIYTESTVLDNLEHAVGQYYGHFEEGIVDRGAMDLFFSAIDTEKAVIVFDGDSPLPAINYNALVDLLDNRGLTGLPSFSVYIVEPTLQYRNKAISPAFFEQNAFAAQGEFVADPGYDPAAIEYDPAVPATEPTPQAVKTGTVAMLGGQFAAYNLSQINGEMYITYLSIPERMHMAEYSGCPSVIMAIQKMEGLTQWSGGGVRPWQEMIPADAQVSFFYDNSFGRRNLLGKESLNDTFSELWNEAAYPGTDGLSVANGGYRAWAGTIVNYVH